MQDNRNRRAGAPSAGKQPRRGSAGMRRSGRRRRMGLQRLIPFAAFLLVGIVSLSLLVDYAVDSAKRRRENEQLAQAYTETFVQATPQASAAPAVQPRAAETQAAQTALPRSFRTLSGKVPQQARQLYKQNSDLVGWLFVEGIVSLPVVYRDNEYYLDHAFNGKKDSGGTLFLDENHPLAEDTQNLVIHGHNMHDSSMFGILVNYNKLSIVKGHPFARFSTMYAPEEYVIFAVMRVSADVNSPRFFNYIGKPVFRDDDDFSRYVSEIKYRSMFEIPVDVQPDDSLLTLATCIDDDRLVVFYRRLREGESRDALLAQVNQADFR